MMSKVNPYVEVTLDLQDDDTIVLRIVELTTILNIDREFAFFGGADTLPASASASASGSWSLTMRQSSLNRLFQFSQELKAEAVAKAKHFSQELKAELKRFSWSHNHASRSAIQNVLIVGGSNGLDSALVARALHQQRARLDRTHSGAKKALKGPRFISSSKNNSVDGWNKVQNSFNKLAKDGYLYRAHFGQCIGMRDDSKEFALELFDALSRRRRLNVDKISSDELYEYWSQITYQSFDSRLQIFFDIASSDELLRKFAEVGSGSTAKKELLQLAKRRRRYRKKITRENDFDDDEQYRENPSSSSSLSRRANLVERKSLLPAVAVTGDFKNMSIFATIDKTWRKTVDRASKVFLEMHYNWHKHLTNDIA
ncbi:unnamed protein product [Camellia sinensis]